MKQKRISRKLRKELEGFREHIRKAISRLRAATFSLENKAMRNQFENTCRTVEDIVKLVYEKPDTMNSVQAVVRKYTDSLLLLSGKYEKLTSLPELSSEVSQLLEKTEKTVTEIQHYLEGVQTRLMSDEILDLDIQLSVLESELELDKLQDNYS